MNIRLLILMLLLINVFSLPSKAEALVADLSEHVVSITTSFTGTELLLFGATDEEGTIVVVVKGPREEVTTRKKEQIGGIWMNRKSVTFEGVPSFYHVAITDTEIFNLPLTARQRHEIGAANVKFDVIEDIPRPVVSPFRQALIRNKQKAGLYSSEPSIVHRRGQQLFRTSVFFPVNVPTGTYIIETLLIRDGEVKSATTTPLFIDKAGFSAKIYRFAYENSALYGIVAILIACFAGLGANWIFRKS